VGSSLQVVESGAIVEVLIQVTTPDTLQQVSLEDLVPAGLEPLDPNVIRVTTAPSTTPNSPFGNYVNLYWYWWNPFSAQETLSDRVRWSSYYLSAGAHTVSYQAIANTVGVYSLPPTKCWAILEPEVMGLSAAGTFLVSATQIADADIPQYLSDMGVAPNSVTTPQDCPACGPRQTCNMQTGNCDCFDPVLGCSAQPESPDPTCPGAGCISTGSSGMSASTKAGITVAVVGLAISSVFFIVRRRKKQARKEEVHESIIPRQNRASSKESVSISLTETGAEHETASLQGSPAQTYKELNRSSPSQTYNELNKK